MAYGHPEARYYPLGMVYDEAALVEERENGKLVAEASFTQLAIATILSSKARTAFTKRSKMLNVETSPRRGIFGERDEGDGAERR